MWLLAKIDKTLRVAANDVVEPYALMANSHDGSMAFNIRLTTVRVVCQNTLALAMRQKIGQHFRRAHQGPFVEHARAAQDFFAATLDELDGIANTFSRLSSCRCSEQKFQDILLRLLPDPRKPKNADRNPRVLEQWERRVRETRVARSTISQLRTTGRGASLAGSHGTLWGFLNAGLGNTFDEIPAKVAPLMGNRSTKTV